MRIYFDYDEEEDSDLVDIQLTEMEIKRLLSFELIEKKILVIHLTLTGI